MTFLGLSLLGGCASKIADFNREPDLTPIGSGLHPALTPIVTNAPSRPVRQDNSFWHDTSSDLFGDPRAARPGDVVTVKISINDNASLGSTSARSRDSSSNHSYDLNYNINTGGVQRRATPRWAGMPPPKRRPQVREPSAVRRASNCW
jgi:flagellar L-ring protein precursor FlgH